MDEYYEGRAAVVTGAGSGIGRSLTGALARRGATVVATDIDGDAAAATAADHGPAVSSAELDVTDAAAFVALVERVVDQHGRIDLLFNNAGIGGAAAGEARLLDLEHWVPVIDVNIGGVVNGVVAAYPRMVDAGAGHIVNTASMAGLVPAPGLTPYATTKHAVVGLSRSLRAEAAGHGVRVTALCPGALDTPILDAQADAGLAGRPDFWMPDLRRYLGRRAGIGDPDRFAAYVLDRLVRNPALVIYGRRARIFHRVFRALPALAAAGAARDFQDERRRSLGT